MTDSNCPWCEAEVILSISSDEQTCSECGTRWMYEDEEIELPLAA